MEDWAKALAECIEAESNAFGEEIYIRDKALRASVGSSEQAEALEMSGYLERERVVIILPSDELLNIDSQPEVNEVLELRNQGFRIVMVRKLEAGHGVELQCELIPEYELRQKPTDPTYITPDVVSDLVAEIAQIAPTAPSDVTTLQIGIPAKPSEISFDISPLSVDQLLTSKSPQEPDQITASVEYVEMYLVAGQSNAHGHSETAELLPDVNDPQQINGTEVIVIASAGIALFDKDEGNISVNYPQGSILRIQTYNSTSNIVRIEDPNDPYVSSSSGIWHWHSWAQVNNTYAIVTPNIGIGFYTSWHNNTSDATTTQYYSDYVTQMEFGKTRGDNNESTLDSEYFGIEWGFAKRLEESNTTNKQIGILKYAVGASTIEDNVNLTDWDLQKTTEAWQGLKNAIADASTKLAAQGKTPTWKGLIWYQGESNAGTDPYIYKEALNDLCQAIEQELEVTDLPAVFIAPADATGNDLFVNNAHASLAKSADFYNFIKASDYHDGINNNVHLSAPNMYDAGYAAGVAMESALAGTATDVEFEPSTNLQFWLDGDDATLVTENSSSHEVTSVAAKAGNINILPKSKDTNAPIIIHEHNAIANRDCFTMSDDREYLQTDGEVALSTGTQDWFIVAKPSINHSQDALWATELGRSITLIPLGANLFTWYYANQAVSSTQASTDQNGVLGMYCIRWNFSGNYTSTWFNGIQVDSQRATPVAISMEDLRFNFMAQYGGSNTTDGNLCEVIVSTEFSKRKEIEGYLAHKWNIANLLPSSHTYKYYAP